MKVDILTFGITKQIIGKTIFSFDVPDLCTVNQLKILLENEFSELKNLGSLHIAVNNEYSEMEQVLNAGDEIALIPPVSGG